MGKKRLLINISLPIENEEEAEAVVLDCRVLIATYHPAAIVAAQVMQLLTPCCGEKNNAYKNN